MRRVSIVFSVVLLSLTMLAGSLPASAGPGSGNSPNAKLCQKGGYATLATSEDQYTAFATEEACVSYAAKGGALTAFVPLSPGCTALNDPSLDGTSPYFTVLTNRAYYNAGETITLTAGGPAEAAGSFFYLVAGLDFARALVPDTVALTITADQSVTANQSVQVRWYTVGLSAPIVNWTVSCGR